MLNGTIWMRTEDFKYELPEHLIAQWPLEERDQCKLMVASRQGGTIDHCTFQDLVTLLKPGDRLVFNNTWVIPARLLVYKSTGGRIELFLHEKVDAYTWRALVKPGRRCSVGTIVTLEGVEAVKIRIHGVLPSGERLVQLASAPDDMNLEEVMERYGHVPLPPYIDRSDQIADRKSYQTIYAAIPGAVAAPTAGLHFTTALLELLTRAGVEFSYLTLHVGMGTFQPVKVADLSDHVMHEEAFILSEQTVREIEQTRATGGRIIAVGTTVVRVLEHCNAIFGRLLPQQGTTRLMIIPPYQFGVVDALITNFHLPRSTLLMLVSAFAGREHILHMYDEAVRNDYRFFSYGDAMFLN